MNNQIQSLLQSIINNSNAMRNPMLKNAVGMANKGDFAGVEKLARNICKERNINADELYDQIRARFVK